MGQRTEEDAAKGEKSRTGQKGEAHGAKEQERQEGEARQRAKRAGEVREPSTEGGRRRQPFQRPCSFQNGEALRKNRVLDVQAPRNGI